MTKCHVLREGAVRSLAEKYTKKQNKNSWGEIRTLDLTGMSRALSPTELPSQGFFFIQLSFGSVASAPVRADGFYSRTKVF